MKTYSSRPGTERRLGIPCPVCGGGEFKDHRICESFFFVRCTSCLHVFQNPQPVFDDLRYRYQEEYFSYELANEEAFFKLMLLGLKDIGFADWEAEVREKGGFLDIGCATGRLLSHMKSRMWNVQGVEICELSARFGIEKRGVPIFTGSLEQSDFPGESFSLIHFSHVIEHLTDPQGFLGKVHDLCVPGGRCVIVTPNIEGFQARLFRTKWRSCIADHLHLFSPRNLERLILEAGFTVLGYKTWGGIAQGLAPAWVKRPLDVMAKRFGFGDVMLFYIRK